MHPNLLDEFHDRLHMMYPGIVHCDDDILSPLGWLLNNGLLPQKLIHLLGFLSTKPGDLEAPFFSPPNPGFDLLDHDAEEVVYANSLMTI